MKQLCKFHHFAKKLSKLVGVFQKRQKINAHFMILTQTWSCLGSKANTLQEPVSLLSFYPTLLWFLMKKFIKWKKWNCDFSSVRNWHFWMKHQTRIPTKCIRFDFWLPSNFVRIENFKPVMVFTFNYGF